MEIHVYHGPNLNRLESRSSEHYGRMKLETINNLLEEWAQELGVDVLSRQSNSEGELVEWIQADNKDGLVLNPAGYTHTSVAIRDAVELVDYPVVEVHLSNLYSRETFRRESRIAGVCVGHISGFGPYSYNLGLRAVVNYLGT